MVSVGTSTSAELVSSGEPLFSLLSSVLLELSGSDGIVSEGVEETGVEGTGADEDVLGVDGAGAVDEEFAPELLGMFGVLGLFGVVDVPVLDEPGVEVEVDVLGKEDEESEFELDSLKEELLSELVVSELESEAVESESLLGL